MVALLKRAEERPKRRYGGGQTGRTRARATTRRLAEFQFRVGPALTRRRVFLLRRPNLGDASN